MSEHGPTADSSSTTLVNLLVALFGRRFEQEVCREVQRDCEWAIARQRALEAAIADHRRGVLSTFELYAVADGRRVMR